MAQGDSQIKVLIVEDDAFLRKILSTKFGKEGFDVVTAGDGEEALEMMRKEGPDLVLLDLVLPKMSGFEVLTDARTDKALSSIPVIVLSNLSQDEDIERVTKLGAVAFLTKVDNSINEIVMRVKEEYARIAEKK